MEIDIKELNLRIQKLKEQNKRLEFLAYKDALTGAYNRNWFNTKVKSSSKLYLSIADLNKLKQANDTYGHLEGDKVIVAVANKLKEFGTLVRFGGDEFLIISKNKDQYDALHIATKCDFSIGGVEPHEYKTIAEALKIADLRLYENKKKNKLYD